MEPVDVDFRFFNYPLNGPDAEVKKVTFGGDDGRFALLIESTADSIIVTAGNGPSHAEAPGLIAEALRDLADVLDDLTEDPDYLAAIEPLRISE